MAFYKVTNKKEHEFILFYFHHWEPSEPATAVLVVDRTVDPNTTARAVQDSQLSQPGLAARAARSSGIISPSASPISAYDAVVTIPNESSITPFLKHRYHSYHQLLTLDFSAASLHPSATEISILLSVISRHAPKYDLYQTQCFWYASTIWEATTRLFPGCQEWSITMGALRILG
jgi:hypothetical protein